MNKKNHKNLLKYIIIFTIIIIGIVVFGIYKYNTHCLIDYVENEPPFGTLVWNDAITVHVKVLNNGTLLSGNNDAKEKLDKEKLKEMRELVAQLKEKSKDLEENNTASDRFTIDSKTYATNSLDSEGKEIISKIGDIIVSKILEI